MKIEAQHTQTYGTLKKSAKRNVTLHAYIKKMEKSHTTYLTAHLKALEQKEANHPGGRENRK